MPAFVNPNQMSWDTTEIPLVAGVDLRSPGRTIQAPALLAAENLRYDSGTSLRKRRGHLGYRVRTLARAVPGQAGGATASYLFGEGVAGNGLNTINDTVGPDAGFLAGMAKRDNEVLAWDGWRLFSWPSGVNPGAGWQNTVPAVMPTAHTEPIAKVSTAQFVADEGETDKLRVVAWVDSSLYVSVYDPTTGAPYLTATDPHAIAVDLNGSSVSPVEDDATQTRVVPCGDWVHVVTAYGDNSYDVISFSAERPDRPIQTQTGDCDTWFDVRKVSEEVWLLLVSGTASETQAFKLSKISANGTNYIIQSKDLSELITAFPGAQQCAVAEHPLTGEICVVFQSTANPANVWSVIFDSTASNPDTASVVTLGDDVVDLTVEAQYVTHNQAGKFTYFASCEDDDGIVTTYDTWFGKGALTAEATCRSAGLNAHAFRVGQAVQVVLGKRYAAATTEFQHAYYITDASLRPVGRLEYGTAPTRWPDGLPSIHFSKGQDARNRTKFHGILVYRVRVDSANNDQYDEESLKLLTLDYLPRLRSAQLGRCTYFAGAQVSAYDGSVVVEAGMHEFPENVSVSTDATSGSPNGTYIYKVRWAYKNAQGEEVVSAETFSPEVTVSNEVITAVIPSLNFSRKEGVYALVYRNEGTPGVVWYLVSSRDSTTSGANGYVANDTSSGSVSFTDNMSDTDLLSREADNIGNAGGLERFSPPACEVIAAGRDRIWLAGGEIPAGSFLPSLTFEAGKAVHFDQRLQTTVDRDSRPITAFGFLGNSTLVFRADRIHAFEADGPNNLGFGSFDNARVITTDAGAQNQEGLVLIEDGLFFQGLGHIQMLGFNYQVTDPGLPLPASGTMTVAGAFLNPVEHEVRFYSATDDQPALVYNLHYRQWTTWHNLTCAGAVPGPGYAACLARQNGRLWVETDGVWTDEGRGIRALWRTAWLRAEHLQAFQRVRHVATVGDYLGAHVLRIRAFYDDRDYPEATAYWDPDDDLNTSRWGDGNWGDGVWGDVDRDETYAKPRDRVFRERRGLARQKCSTVSFEIDDGGSHSEGPALTALAVEFGRRGGLGRIPARSFS